MINQTAVKVSFRLNNGREAEIKKEATIYIRVRQGRAVDFKASLGWKVFPSDWNTDIQRVRNRTHILNRDTINNHLNSLQNHILISASELKAKGIPFNIKLAKRIFQEYFETPKETINLFQFIDKFIEDAKTKPNHKTGKPVSKQTLTSYETTKNFLNRFNKENYKIDFENITLDFYYDFIEFGNTNSLSKNYIGKHIKTLKTFLNEAVEQGLTDNEQFKSKKFIVLKEEADNIYLTIRELEIIGKVELRSNTHMEKARDIFLIGAFTGLRVSDFNNLSKENIINLKGVRVLKVKTKKTGKLVQVPLHPVVDSILEKYNGSLPNKMPDQHINRFIKTVGELANIKDKVKITQTVGGKEITKTFNKFELIKTHTARRSFCTNAYLSGMPSIDIMALSGHKTESAFMKYIKVTGEETALKISKHPFFQESTTLKAV